MPPTVETHKQTKPSPDTLEQVKDNRNKVETRVVREMLADILSLPLCEVHAEASFYGLGGDSITALNFAMRCSAKAIEVQSGHVLECSSLGELAVRMRYCEASTNKASIEAWSLAADLNRELVERKVQEQCGLSGGSNKIADLYPVTPFQESFMTLAANEPGFYATEFHFTLPDDVDLERFQAAWAQVFQLYPILRTRIVLINGSMWQAVITEKAEFIAEDAKSPASIPESRNDMQYGSKLCHYKLYTWNAKHFFSMTLHHAIHDGWCLGMISETLTQYYDSGPPFEHTLVPFVDLVSYTLTVDTPKARDYWKRQLRTAKRTVFPSRHQVGQAVPSSKSAKFRHHIKLPTRPKPVTASSILQAAWAIVLAAYEDYADDITFGFVVHGRRAPIDGIERIAGPVLSTVPVRVKLDRQQSVARFLHDIQVRANEMAMFEQLGLHNISQLGQNEQEACQFSTLLIIQPDTIWARPNTSLLTLCDPDLVSGNSDNIRYLNYPLVVQVHLNSDKIELYITYDISLLYKEQVARIADQYEFVLGQLLSPEAFTDPLYTLSNISLYGPCDIAQILQWNASGPQLITVETCVHELISNTASRVADKEAIFAWDGRRTYGELEQMSNRLATHLLELGVEVESLVPICFEKSMWTVVAMLAVMKAGGAFVPINPDHPPARHRALVAGLRAPLMLASPTTADDCGEMGLTVVPVSASIFSTLPQPLFYSRQPTTPGNTAYVLFTSGSTGTPKGVVVEHRALASTITVHGTRIGLSQSSRVLQFSSYMFDVSVGEIFATLLFGGSVCVPSDADRMTNLKSFINTAQVDCAMLTPSFASTLEPEGVPFLGTIVLAGEPATQENVFTWKEKVHLMNNYGPAEACIYASSHDIRDSEISPSTIGRGCNTIVWIVEVEDYNRLAPVGCVGELLIQGPALARAYLNDAEKTSCSFIHSPSWVPPSPFLRLYKTGDLARYNKDGTIDYIGRKDLQIKIRGQRVEPGEIEYHIKRLLPALVQVAVTLVPTGIRSSLVAFVCITPTSNSQKCLVREMNSSLRGTFDTVAEQLAELLPPYMVPAHYVPLTALPLTASLKADKDFLRGLLAGLTTEDMSLYLIGQTTEFRAPSNEIESSLRSMWSRVLGVHEAEIGVVDNFYKLGGDSIKIVTLGELIKGQYAVALRRDLVNSSRTTICSIASFIAKTEVEKERGRKIDLLSEFDELWKDVQMPNMDLSDEPWTRPLAANTNIFLTGGTGYLGTYILRRLVQHHQVSRITVLVRAKDESQGVAGLIESARLARWWRAEHKEKIQVWTGDLARLGLGLPQDQWRILNGRSQGRCIDAIIHNGAAVEWTADYSTLRAANVDSTLQLLNVMLTSPARPKMVYISGGVKIDMADREAVAGALSYAIGYSQTKFVSEALVRECTARLPSTQNVLSTIKSGFIIGSLDQGVANTDDLIWRMVASAARVGAYPIEPAEHWMFMSDVDAVVDTAVTQLTSDSPE